MSIVGINMSRNGLKDRYSRQASVTKFNKKGRCHSESICSLRMSSNKHYCSLRYHSDYQHNLLKGNKAFSLHRIRYNVKSKPLLIYISTQVYRFKSYISYGG